MSVFTDKEMQYLLSQRLGRLATVRPDGRPQVAPVGFRYNAELDVIDIGGRYLSRTKKFRNILENSYVSLVIEHCFLSTAHFRRHLFTGGQRCASASLHSPVSR